MKSASPYVHLARCRPFVPSVRACDACRPFIVAFDASTTAATCSSHSLLATRTLRVCMPASLFLSLGLLLVCLFDLATVCRPDLAARPFYTYPEPAHVAHNDGPHVAYRNVHVQEAWSQRDMWWISPNHCFMFLGHCQGNKAPQTPRPLLEQQDASDSPVIVRVTRHLRETQVASHLKDITVRRHCIQTSM